MIVISDISFLIIVNLYSIRYNYLTYSIVSTALLYGHLDVLGYAVVHKYCYCALTLALGGNLAAL